CERWHVDFHRSTLGGCPSGWETNVRNCHVSSGLRREIRFRMVYPSAKRIGARVRPAVTAAIRFNKVSQIQCAYSFGWRSGITKSYRNQVVRLQNVLGGDLTFVIAGGDLCPTAACEVR